MHREQLDKENEFRGQWYQYMMCALGLSVNDPLYYRSLITSGYMSVPSRIFRYVVRDIQYSSFKGIYVHTVL